MANRLGVGKGSVSCNEASNQDVRPSMAPFGLFEDEG